MNKKVLGIDGCPKGWVIVSAQEGQRPEIQVYEYLKEAKDKIQKAAYAIIDMPIGLIESKKEERLSDQALRRVLGNRKSSIFPVPCRQAVYAKTYEEANQVNREILGKGLSKQTWNITDKIREVDLFLTHEKLGTECQEILLESSPELAFMSLGMSDHPMSANKKTEDGCRQRLECLSQFSSYASAAYQEALDNFKRKDLAKDDILDAMALAFMGLVILQKGIRYFPSEEYRDKKGLLLNAVGVNKQEKRL